MPVSPKSPGYFGHISKTKALLRKYLEEKYKTETNTQPPFKYISNSCLILKLFLIVSQVQTSLKEITKQDNLIEKATSKLSIQYFSFSKPGLE